MKTEAVFFFPDYQQSFFFFVDEKLVSAADYKAAQKKDPQARTYTPESGKGIPADLPDHFRENIPLAAVFPCIEWQKAKRWTPGPQDSDFLKDIEANRKNLASCTADEIKRLEALQIEQYKKAR